MHLQMGIVLNLGIKDLPFGWRVSLGVQFVVGTTLALGMLLLPRSPRLVLSYENSQLSVKILLFHFFILHQVVSEEM